MDEPAERGRPHSWLAGARPRVDVAEIAATAHARWGLGDFVVELGSHQDRNLLFESPHGRVVVKVANVAWERSALEAQAAALQAVSHSDVLVPAVVRRVAKERFGDHEYWTQVVTFIEGESLFDRAALDPAGCRAIGTAAGETARALAGFAHPGAVRDSEWDLRAAGRVLEGKSPSLRDAVEPFLDRVAVQGSGLPVQVIHGDVTDSNVLVTPAGDLAVIDFGDVGESWRCAELAVAAASVLGKTDDDVSAVLAVVESFTRRVPLADDELSALWSLVVLRVAVLLATGDGDDDEPNAYTRAREAFERQAFSAALALDADEMARLIRDAGS